MTRRITHGLLAAAMAFTTLGATISEAQARGGRVAAGVAAGIIGLGILGAYAHARDRHYYGRHCYAGPRECFWVEGRCWFNRYGERVCKGGREVCERRTYCD